MQLNEKIFNREYSQGLVHQVVVSYMATARQGTKAQKNRSEVSGGNKKPWKQKGTGRARAGTTRGPIWRKGGVAFAAKPRDYTQKVNKKAYREALKSMLSELNRLGRLHVVSDFVIESRKTKDCVAKLKELKVDNALIIKDSLDEATFYAARNVPNVLVIDVQTLNPLVLVQYQNVVVTEAAVKKIEEMLS